MYQKFKNKELIEEYIKVIHEKHDGILNFEIPVWNEETQKNECKTFPTVIKEIKLIDNCIVGIIFMITYCLTDNAEKKYMIPENLFLKSVESIKLS